ncbi:MAG: hypothetical protein J0I84_02050 [Terrimonas sp.]|nr:hypothetical protein [Terrimonas sp.]OJY93869.1 MAG: hypothetical protein BGP13_01075 [Sphingobacteriales bacterium 40-81]
MHIEKFWYILIFAFFAGCSNGIGDSVHQKDDSLANVDIDSMEADTLTLLKQGANDDDIPANDFLRDTLKPVRENLKRISTIANWSTIDTKDIDAGEGGEAKFYYKDGKLEKIVVRQLGETFQQLAEYYLQDNKLSFVFEKTYRYNRPIFYDSTVMKENNDTEAFDFKKSTITEDRSYFINNKLIHQVNNEDCGAPFAADYLRDEQKRIETEFEELTRLLKGK